MPRRPEWLVLALIVVAAALRLYVNDVVVWSRADETVYLNDARSSYPDVVRSYIADRGMWVFPSPLRWSWIGATSLCCTSYRAIATLSMIAGIAAVALTWWIARRLFDENVALFATALAATSPLQLALGRRALADEFFCALVLASIAAMLMHFETKHVGWLIAWIALTTLALGAKEQFLLIYPVVLAFWWLRARSMSWTWILPPVLYVAVFCLLARDVTSFFTIARLTTSTIGAPYADQFQNGPPQRFLIDLIAIAPLVTLIAIIAIGSLRTPAQRHVAFLAIGIIAVHALISSKNVRYVVTADSPMRILAASWLATDMRRAWILIAINAAIELAIFHQVFITAGVYDPVTHDLLHALRMLPSS